MIFGHPGTVISRRQKRRDRRSVRWKSGEGKSSTIYTEVELVASPAEEQRTEFDPACLRLWIWRPIIQSSRVRENL